MEAVTVKYKNSGTVYSQAFGALSVRGFDNPDKVSFFPPILYDKIDGSKETAFKGFRRIITVDLGVVSSRDNRKLVQSFLDSNDKFILFKGEETEIRQARVVFENGEYENDWKWDTNLGRSFSLELIENSIHTRWPWPPSDTMIGYSINNVLLIGTQEAPEYFVTNVDKLLYRFGTTGWPDINIDDYNITFVFGPYSNFTVNQVGAIDQVGTNIGFYLAMGSNPMAISGGTYDGQIRTDVTILLDPKI